MTRPKLSLGIPVYNQADTIEATVASALDQVEPFDEIVIVNNHCNDGTSEKLQAFAGRVRIISPPRHLGMVQNWNFCIEHLRNNWFSLLSGDDLLKPLFTSKVADAIAAHSGAALVRTDWDVIDGGGKVRDRRRQLSVARVTRPPKTWREQIYGPKVSFAAFATRRDLWEKVGGFPVDFYLFQDWMFWLKLAPLGNFIRVPEVLAQYRSEDRPDLDSRRAALRLLDEYRYAMEVLPTLPWRKPLAQLSIQTARARRFSELLRFLTNHAAVVEEAGAQIKLATWARAAEMNQVYDQWLVSRTLPPLPFLRRIKDAGKQVGRRILS